ncbi:phospholipase D family protein [Haloferax chudinovii]|uniref:Phospholipase D family protein n=1 Tax=Haloferax chudinovii TaxID=1109010 RepID=A0ABD5XJ99_9EURY
MSRFIYHSEGSYDSAESPFDEAIRDTADAENVRIVCPYINPSYLKSILAPANDWRIVTDVEAWIGTFGGSTRDEIRELIATNREQIHHFPNVHAKAVLSDDSAVIGSANLTEKGIFGRTEMGIQFTAESKIDELNEWFTRLWSESDSVDSGELDEFVESSPSTPTTHTESGTSLSSDAPQVNAIFVDDTEPTTKEIDANEEVHDTLVNRVQQAPNRGWAVDFFGLLNDLIAATGLAEDDARLVTSIAQNDRIAVSINNRYVLGAFFSGEPTTGFIVGADTENVDELIETADEHMAFNALSGEATDETPHWVEFTGEPKRMVSQSFRRAWISAVYDQLEQASGSPYQDSHEPLVFRAGVEEEYREQILRDAYNMSDSTDTSHTNRGIKQALCRRAMPRGQVTLLKCLYENDRPVSVEELADEIRGGDVDSCTSILGPLSKRINNTPEVSGEPGFSALIRKIQDEKQHYYELREESRRIIEDMPRLLSEFERDMDDLRSEENPVIEGREFEENQG